MTDAERTRQYREFAMLCEDKKRRKCRADCSRCPLNISLYPDLAAGDAVAIQTKAAIDYYEKRSTVIANAIVKAFIWVFWIGVALWCWTSFRSCVNAPKEIRYYKDNIYPNAEEEKAIQFVRKTIHKNIIDMNYDKQINCVDYAMMFCLLMPKSAIFVNQRPPMNHAFNGVMLESGKVLYVEPSSTGSANKYRMEDVWKVPEEYERGVNYNWTAIYTTLFATHAFFNSSDDFKEFNDIYQQRLDEWEY